VVHSQYRRHLDERLALAINIETVFNICWSLVINCFSPSRVIYLELHPSSNSCYISDTFKPNSESYSLEFTADRLLKDLVRDFCRVKAGLSFALPGDSLPPDSQGRFLSSAIRYTDDQFHFHEAPHVVNSTVRLYLIQYLRNPDSRNNPRSLGRSYGSILPVTTVACARA
jgi:hypothetical protein